MRRLTASGLEPYRNKLLKEQNGLDPITGQTITDPVVDHDHSTGAVRAVLQRWNNGVLGRVENWAGRIGGGIDPVLYLRAVADYLEFHQKYPRDVTYHTHRTADEKRVLRNKRAVVRRKKAKESSANRND